MNTRRKPNQPLPPKNATKARSLRHPRPFVLAVALAAVHFLTLFAAITSVVLFIMDPQELTMQLLLGSVATSIFTWILAYFKRKAVLCPLCKGTPLFNSGAMPHPNATRLWPFNYGLSAVLSLLFTQHFRCMYCGCRYDLLREPRDHRHIDDEEGPRFRNA